MATIFTHPVVALGLTPWLNFQEKRKQIIFIACLLLITSSSYATSANKGGSKDPASLKGTKIGGGAATFVTCIHQRTWYNKRKKIWITTPVYAYAAGSSLLPCPAFSLEYEHPDNIVQIRDPNETEWGVYSVPIFDTGVHEHCNAKKQPQACALDEDGIPQCELTPGCIVSDSPTIPYNGSTRSALDLFKTKPSLINQGSANRVDPMNHCNVGHGNPL